MIEKLLNELPYFITKTVEQLCPTCRKIHITKMICYELKIDVLPNENGHRYRVYYQSKEYGSFEKIKYIGENVGYGYSTLKEAIEKLKEYLK